MSVIPSRVLNSTYIVLDILFLLSLAVLLWVNRRRQALIGDPPRGGGRSLSLFAVAEYELWIYQFRMDLAVAGP